jgi:uncharacterized protein YceH (UPF0502 family)
VSPRALLLVALAAPVPVSAADWVRVDTADQHQHFYDRSKLHVEGDAITYWRRVVFRAPQPARAGAARMAMYRESMDCARHTYRTLGYLLYSQDGSVLDNVYSPDAAAEPIIPETVGDRFESLMCIFVEQAKLSQSSAQSEVAAPAEIDARIQQLEAELRALRDRARTSAAPAPEGEAR